MKNKLVIRVDGGFEIGMGHITHTMNLAFYLQNYYGYEVVFYSKEKAGVDFLRENGCFVRKLPAVDFAQEGEVILSLLAGEQSRAVIFDLPVFYWSRYNGIFMLIKEFGLPLIFLNNTVSNRSVADLTINSLCHVPYPAGEVLGANVYEGLEYLVFNRQFIDYARRQKIIRPVHKKILVSFGGSDPAGITAKILPLLEDIPAEAEITLVLGPAYRDENALEEYLSKADRQFQVRQNIKNMAEELYNADLALLSLGTTAYEAALVGTPALLINPYPLHVQVAEELARYGYCRNLGLLTPENRDSIRGEILDVLEDTARLCEMSFNARKCMDGLGWQRTIELMRRRLEI